MEILDILASSDMRIEDFFIEYSTMFCVCLGIL